MQFLTQPGRKAETCTILVRDVPGIYYGTVADRVERTVLRFLPAFVKRRIVVSFCFGIRALRPQSATGGANVCSRLRREQAVFCKWAGMWTC